MANGRKRWETRPFRGVSWARVRFAPAFSGMLTTQLTRTDWFAWKAEIYLTDKDVKEAIRRLREA